MNAKSFFGMLSQYREAIQEIQNALVWEDVFENKMFDEQNIDVNQQIQNSESIKNSIQRSHLINQDKHIRIKKIDQKAQKKWNAVVFGECGQGKSTVLSKIARLYADNFCPPGSHATHFVSKQSYASVTPCVKIGSTGDMTLIDSPGFNDADIQKTDKNIMIELIRIIRPMLYDRN